MVSAKYFLISRFVLSLLSAASGLAFIIGLQSLINSLSLKNHHSAVIDILIICAAAIVGLSSTYCAQRVKLLCDLRIGVELSSSMLKAIFRGRFGGLHGLQSGDVLTRIQEAAGLHVAVTDSLLRGATEIFFLGIAASYALTLSIPLTFIVIICFPLSFLISRFGASWLSEPTSEQLRLQSDYTSELIGAVRHEREIANLGGGKFWTKRLIGKLENIADTQYKVKKVAINIQSANNLLVRFVECIVLAVGVQLAARGELFPGDLMAFYLLMVRLTNPLVLIAGVADAWKYAQIALARIEPLLSSNGPDVTVRARDNELGLRLDKIELKFAAGKSLTTPLLKFRPGIKVILQGAVGSGKSSLLHAIVGDRELAAGSITLDGKPISQASPTDILYVGEKPFMFSGSVFENIILERDVNFCEVQSLVDELNLGAVIGTGLNLTVNSDELGLSSGQRQATALVRALLRKPSVLLLDEATSNLDRKTEAAFLLALHSHRPDMTVVLATHRELSVNWADKKLLVMGTALRVVPLEKKEI